ncbi:MAG: type II toxin-antitoxin system RelE/ParE family toxin [Bacteroidota bacterium]
MAKFNLTKKAVGDLSRNWNYTFDKWSEQQADRYYSLLMKSCQEIADNPTIGKRYPGIKNNLYGFNANRHIVFYREIENQSIEITRILHERMDLKK